jgi:NitT/TauT family transport system ATP-binding protein
LLQVDGLGRRHTNGVSALEALSFEVAAGELLGIVGPSGCGKSTALRIVAGLDRPTAGLIRWAGGTAPSIGFVFQDPALLPWASAADNVYLPLRLRGVGRRDAARLIDEALASVGLSAWADALPRELSGGMRMRVSIARALVTRPALLLMDEPFAALDEISRGRLNDDLLALATDQRLSVVFVTHSVYEAVYLCHRVLVMTPGPGRIHAALHIDEPQPRDESFRTSVRYGERCAAVSGALRAASANTTANLDEAN